MRLLGWGKSRIFERTRYDSVTFSILNYFVTFQIDKLSKKSSETEFEGKTLYATHLSQSDVNRGVKAGKMFQGTFYRSRTNFQEGTVNCDSLEKPVLIQGKEITITFG